MLLSAINRLSLSAVILILAVLLIQLAGQPVEVILRYEREGVTQWQLWRLLTGHLVHLGWLHLVLNLGGLLLLVLGFGDRFVRDAGRLAMSMSLLGLGVSLGLWWGSPDVDWYVGLSGVLHGLAVLLAADMWRDERMASALLFGGLVVKVSWEQVTGGELALAEAIGGTVVVDAHLYGVVSGVIILGVGKIWQFMRQKSAPPESRSEENQ